MTQADSFDLGSCTSISALEGFVNNIKRKKGSGVGHVYSVGPSKESFTLVQITAQFLSLCREKDSTLEEPEKILALYDKICAMNGGEASFLLKEVELRIREIAEKKMSLKNIIVVGDGAIVITPTNISEMQTSTVTVKVLDTYVKLRGIVVRLEAEESKKKGYVPENWIHIGSFPSTVLLSWEQVWWACQIEPENGSLVEKIILELASSKTPVALVPLSDELLWRSIPRLKREYFKISCVMSPEGELIPVALREIGEGSYKIVKEAYVLWQRNVQGSVDSLVAIGKGKMVLDEDKRSKLDENERAVVYVQDLAREAPLVAQLISARVPYILRLRIIKRAYGKKIGLMMEHCSGGTLARFKEGHFDLDTRKVLPEHREQHRKLLVQVAQALVGMHEQGIVHTDLKAANVLLKIIEGGRLEVRVSDFGLANRVGVKIKRLPGTYYPPETLRSSEIQKLKFPDKAPSYTVTKEFDAWTFGLLMFDMMHDWKGERQLPRSLDAREDPLESKPIPLLKATRLLESYREAHSRIIGLLDPTDKIDQIIVLLLDLNPQTRLSLPEAFYLLEQINC